MDWLLINQEPYSQSNVSLKRVTDHKCMKMNHLGYEIKPVQFFSNILNKLLYKILFEVLLNNNSINE